MSDEENREVVRQSEMRLKIFEAILSERLRQEALKRQGKFLYTCADPQMQSAEKYLVLGEEFGEVGRAILNLQGFATDYGAGIEEVRKELVQLAAVAFAWLEFLEGVGQVIPGRKPAGRTTTNEGKTPRLV